MSSNCIFSWLETIPSDFAKRPTPVTRDPSLSCKRRRLQPPTPEASVTKSLDDAMSSASRPGSASKRPAEPSDETPKASRSNKRGRTPRSESSCSLPASQSRYYVSSQSGQSSPLRDPTLERDERGLKPRDLSRFHPRPPALKVMLDKIELFAYAEGILPASARDTFDMLDDEIYWDMEWARQGSRSNKHYSTEREALGDTPSPDAVREIVSEAAECSDNGHPEVNWNIAVHSRVLDMALKSQGCQSRLVNSMCSSTASIIHEYHRSASRAKKVDFCIYLEPSNDPSYPEAEFDVDRLADTLLCGVINHTDFYPLRSRPIALSIETKKTGDNWDKAKLQLGVWEAARWTFLRHLLWTDTNQAAQGQPATEYDDQENDGPAPQAHLSELPEFLPGIIIQGHDWNLVITTQEKEKTILWQKIPMGSTSNTKGVYQIICCLQLLRQWAQDTFWPWLKEIIRQSSKPSLS